MFSFLRGPVATRVSLWSPCRVGRAAQEVIHGGCGPVLAMPGFQGQLSAHSRTGRVTEQRGCDGWSFMVQTALWLGRFRWPGGHAISMGLWWALRLSSGMESELEGCMGQESTHLSKLPRACGVRVCGSLKAWCSAHHVPWPHWETGGPGSLISALCLKPESVSSRPGVQNLECRVFQGFWRCEPCFSYEGRSKCSFQR